MSRYLNIVCIDNSEFAHSLTIGKEYQAIVYKQRDDGYVIKNDDLGIKEVFYYAYRFETPTQRASRVNLPEDLFTV